MGRNLCYILMSSVKLTLTVLCIWIRTNALKVSGETWPKVIPFASKITQGTEVLSLLCARPWKGFPPPWEWKPKPWTWPNGPMRNGGYEEGPALPSSQIGLCPRCSLCRALSPRLHRAPSPSGFSLSITSVLPRPLFKWQVPWPPSHFIFRTVDVSYLLILSLSPVEWM